MAACLFSTTVICVQRLALHQHQLARSLAAGPCSTHLRSHCTMQQASFCTDHADLVILLLCEAMYHTGAVLPLIQLLSSSDDSCREAAALALCFLGWSSTDAKDEAFSKLCSAALEGSGASTAPYPFAALLQSHLPAQRQAAAYAMHMISQVCINEPARHAPCHALAT